MQSNRQVSQPGRFQLCFRSRSLDGETVAVAFPCDERGEVDLDQLSDEERRNYLFARIVTRHSNIPPELLCAQAEND